MDVPLSTKQMLEQNLALSQSFSNANIPVLQRFAMTTPSAYRNIQSVFLGQQCQAKPSATELIMYLHTMPKRIAIFKLKDITKKQYSYRELLCFIIISSPSTATFDMKMHSVSDDINIYYIDNIEVERIEDVRFARQGWDEYSYEPYYYNSYDDILLGAYLVTDPKHQNEKYTSEPIIEGKTVRSFTIDPLTMYNVFRRRSSCLDIDPTGEIAVQTVLNYFDATIKELESSLPVQLYYINGCAVVLELPLNQSLLEFRSFRKGYYQTKDESKRKKGIASIEKSRRKLDDQTREARINLIAAIRNRILMFNQV